MATQDDDKSGDDGSATKTAGKTDDANTDQNADKSKETKNEKGKGDDEKKFSQAELDDIISKRLARKEKEDAEKAKLTKEQLLEKERDEAIAKAAKADLRDTFISESGIEYARASRLFRIYGDDIEVDDKTGKPTNLKDVLKTAKKEFPEMFGNKPDGGGDLGGGNAGDGKPTGGGMNTFIRRAAGRK